MLYEHFTSIYNRLKGIGNASRERIVITELNLAMLVTGLLIISSLPEGKEVGFSSY